MKTLPSLLAPVHIAGKTMCQLKAALEATCTLQTQPDEVCQCCRPMFCSDRVHYARVCIISSSLNPLRLWTLCIQCLPLLMLQA